MGVEVAEEEGSITEGERGRSGCCFSSVGIGHGNHALAFAGQGRSPDRGRGEGPERRGRGGGRGGGRGDKAVGLEGGAAGGGGGEGVVVDGLSGVREPVLPPAFALLLAQGARGLVEEATAVRRCVRGVNEEEAGGGREGGGGEVEREEEKGGKGEEGSRPRSATAAVTSPVMMIDASCE